MFLELLVDYLLIINLKYNSNSGRLILGIMNKDSYILIDKWFGIRISNGVKELNYVLEEMKDGLKK